ncbi:MAG: reverse transcriptase [Alphaproteobacteria bacterium]|nr:reverse transcriptase [Alphaproteobacteria bacterium]
MRDGYGHGACAHDLVGVAAAPAVAPCANGKRPTAPGTSRHGLDGVDARQIMSALPTCNRHPGLYTPDMTGQRRLRLGAELQQRQPELQQQEQSMARQGCPQIKTYRSEITVAQLFEAYFECRRHKRNSASALAFEVNLESNLIDLHEELVSGAWQPRPATTFVITRPKPREVWAADFRDRIVHHLVYAAIAPRIETAFIADSCACIKGRGTLYAANRLAQHLRSETEGWSKPVFYLKADIANFFVSIRRADLFAMLEARVRDETMLDLCRKLVFQDVKRDCIVKGSPQSFARVPRHKSLFHAPEGNGLPIGNLSSQFFANVYLDGLDQMVKRKLGIRPYVRYVDDMLLLHHEPKALLSAANAIREHLSSIGLKLAESKTFVAPVDKGVDFVGHVIRPHRRQTRPRTHRAALARIATTAQAELPATVTAYLGLTKHSGSRPQREQIARAAIHRGLWVEADLSKAKERR